LQPALAYGDAVYLDQETECVLRNTTIADTKKFNNTFFISE
jgi:hypothetical protein